MTNVKKSSCKRKAPGMLPSPKWLKEHGYGELVKVMQKHPKDFSHIRQEGNP